MSKRKMNLESSDTKLTLGYNFLDKKYYIENNSNSAHNTTTYRNSAEEALQVVLAMGIETIGDNIAIHDENKDKTVRAKDYPEVIVKGISDSAVNYVKSSIEYITETLEEDDGKLSIFYTMEDDGSYIKSVQFNEWENYPLVVDCTKGNIYIKNTSILYSLDIEEDPINRIEHFFSYYLNSLGLLVHTDSTFDSEEDKFKYMRGVYHLLANQYLKPHFYNQIIREDNTGSLVYNNIFAIYNPNNSSPLTCTCTRNPYNSTPSPLLIGNITEIDNATNLISYWLGEVPNEPYYQNLRINNQVLVTNSSYKENETEYSADGLYSIGALDKDKGDINTEESPSASWHLPTCYLWSPIVAIKKIEVDGNKITIDDSASVPGNLIVGDKIFITGTKMTVDAEEVSCDGEYTIIYISGKEIGVSEDIPYNYPQGTHSGTPQFHKELYAGEIVKVVEDSNKTTLFLRDNPEVVISSGSIVSLYNTGNNKYYHTVSSVSDNSFTVSSFVASEVPIATLSFANPSEVIKVNVTSIHDYLRDYLAIEEFSVENFNMCQNYINTLWYQDNEVTKEYSRIPQLEETIGLNLYQKIVTDTRVPLSATENITIYFKGLYGEVYEEEKGD